MLTPARLRHEARLTVMNRAAETAGDVFKTNSGQPGGWANEALPAPPSSGAKRSRSGLSDFSPLLSIIQKKIRYCYVPRHQLFFFLFSRLVGLRRS